jgi:hypothetical protein
MGRRRGAVNKISAEARELIAEAFKRLGGVNGLIEWAQKSDKHMTAFYTKMYMKLVPAQMNLDMQVEGVVVRNYTGRQAPEEQDVNNNVPKTINGIETVKAPGHDTPIGRTITGEFVAIPRDTHG